MPSSVEYLFTRAGPLSVFYRILRYTIKTTRPMINGCILATKKYYPTTSLFDGIVFFSIQHKLCRFFFAAHHILLYKIKMNTYFESDFSKSLFLSDEKIELSCV